jgi:hypothetical protein
VKGGPAFNHLAIRNSDASRVGRSFMLLPFAHVFERAKRAEKNPLGCQQQRTPSFSYIFLACGLELSAPKGMLGSEKKLFKATVPSLMTAAQKCQTF